MIQNFFLSYTWLSPGMVILLLFLFGMTGVTIALDVRNTNQGHAQGRYNRWYQRPGIFLGAMQGVAFLIMLADLALFRPPIFFSSVVTIVGMIIILALGIGALISIVFFGQTKTTIYELSASRRMATWKWVSNSQSLLTAWTPCPPGDGYHRQMQALHELIITRTKLPLYDLDNAEGEEKHQIELEVSQQ